MAQNDSRSPPSRLRGLRPQRRLCCVAQNATATRSPHPRTRLAGNPSCDGARRIAITSSGFRYTLRRIAWEVLERKAASCPAIVPVLLYGRDTTRRLERIGTVVCPRRCRLGGCRRRRASPDTQRRSDASDAHGRSSLRSRRRHPGPRPVPRRHGARPRLSAAARSRSPPARLPGQRGPALHCETLGGWESPGVELRGHSAGHYLSACALNIEAPVIPRSRSASTPWWRASHVRVQARDDWDATSANLFEFLLVPGLE